MFSRLITCRCGTPRIIVLSPLACKRRCTRGRMGKLDQSSDTARAFAVYLNNLAIRSLIRDIDGPSRRQYSGYLPLPRFLSCSGRIRAGKISYIDLIAFQYRVKLISSFLFGQVQENIQTRGRISSFHHANTKILHIVQSCFLLPSKISSSA